MGRGTANIGHHVCCELHLKKKNRKEKKEKCDMILAVASHWTPRVTEALDEVPVVLLPPSRRQVSTLLHKINCLKKTS
jgi:hypothetical protein